MEDAQAPAAVELEPSVGHVEPVDPPASDRPIAGYRVQLSAEASRELALARWTELSAAAPDLLGTFSPHVSAAPDTGGGTLYRLRTSPRLSQREAQALCDALTGRAIACYVSTVRNGPQAADDAGAKANDVAPGGVAPAEPEEPA